MMKDLGHFSIRPVTEVPWLGYIFSSIPVLFLVKALATYVTHTTMKDQNRLENTNKTEKAFQI